MLGNPNAFFYRDRPPGDPQKFGPFTAEEERQFHERLDYCRKLGVEDALWGLFAVPILGRVGYQCASFYRSSIRQGKVTGSRYILASDGQLRHDPLAAQAVPSEAITVLEREALEFTEARLREDDRVSGPIRVDPVDGRRLREVTFRRMSGQVGRMESVVIAEAHRSVHRSVHEPRGESVPASIPAPRPAPESDSTSVSEWESELEPEAESEGEQTESGIRHRTGDNEWSCLRSAIDMVTGEPMAEPYIDPISGLVFDYSTWVELLEGRKTCPLEWWAVSTDELVRLTNRNYRRYYYDIVNY
jgi:hypothetical protein